MFDDKWIPLGAGALFSLIGAWLSARAQMRKSKDDLTIDERKAQRDSDDASRKELMSWHTELIARLREEVTRVSGERDAAISRAEQAEARAERLAALLDVAGRQHARDAAIHRSAETAILRGGEPWGDSGSA